MNSIRVLKLVYKDPLEIKLTTNLWRPFSLIVLYLGSFGGGLTQKGGVSELGFQHGCIALFTNRFVIASSKLAGSTHYYHMRPRVHVLFITKPKNENKNLRPKPN